MTGGGNLFQVGGAVNAGQGGGGASAFGPGGAANFTPVSLYGGGGGAFPNGGTFGANGFMELTYYAF